MSELREELSGEGMVAAEALRLGDKAEQPLRIATCECRHGSQKIRRTSHGLKRAKPRFLLRKEGLCTRLILRSGSVLRAGGAGGRLWRFPASLQSRRWRWHSLGRPARPVTQRLRCRPGTP